ncbi:MFS transporter [Leeuwenhoekiella aequorea]|uniref:Nitrate/nitrite transporter NarK n=1 Tax=Leeuwenhoekiella aequorea TaxID=283736 RepID=A0A4Q0PBH3_9FLAO|nr:MFS transporter [Leeuwenhoekiella aequorea]RXG23706.1 nitrate/nitrite transporter NarK [Leeuwenhoekiella aequorea]
MIISSKSRVVFIIVIAQFLGTSLWFVGNIVVPQLPFSDLGRSDAIRTILAAVQFGFIAGTLLFALLAISDRYAPSKVFLICAALGALVNLTLLAPSVSFTTILISRFLTGFCLAGIYPVGMKIASDYFEKGLGKVLGYLVGALVLGTALPHFLNSLGVAINYKTITLLTSILALTGGLLVGLGVPNGPFRKAQQQIKLAGLSTMFKHRPFKAAAIGYWGHMWELYAFWGFVPLYITLYNTENALNINIPLLAFLTLSIGAVSCALGGHISKKTTSKSVALFSLSASGICCLVSPFLLLAPLWVFIVFILFWGAVVVADSPQFSTLIANNTIAEYRGTALTIVNCIGFAITIVSIQFVGYFVENYAPYLFLILALGPIIGVSNLIFQKK